MLDAATKRQITTHARDCVSAAMDNDSDGVGKHLQVIFKLESQGVFGALVTWAGFNAMAMGISKEEWLSGESFAEIGVTDALTGRALDPDAVEQPDLAWVFRFQAAFLNSDVAQMRALFNHLEELEDDAAVDYLMRFLEMTVETQRKKGW